MSGVIFMPSRYKDEAARQDEAFLRACREAGIAVVLIERNLRGLRPAARILTSSRPTTSTADCGAPGTCSTRAGGGSRSSPGRRPAATRAAWPAISPRCTTRATGCGPLVLEQPSGLATKESYAELADRIRTHAADGVVCYQDYTALGLILELLNRGVRVPADVAITGFDNLPIGKAYSIGVTTYAFSSESVARQAIRLIRAASRGDTGPPVKVLVPGELIVRESSRPVEPARGERTAGRW